MFDLEKLYIPPQLDRDQGLYGNQILCERALLDDLALEAPASSHLLDMGCGRGRIAHHLASLTGGQVSGYNIDPDQIENAIGWAARVRHDRPTPLPGREPPRSAAYESETFDGCYSVQAVWPFFKKDELDAHAEEMFRVLKPGARGTPAPSTC